MEDFAEHVLKLNEGERTLKREANEEFEVEEEREVLRAAMTEEVMAVKVTELPPAQKHQLMLDFYMNPNYNFYEC